jgi:hypothetical protein
MEEGVEREEDKGAREERTRDREMRDERDK